MSSFTQYIDDATSLALNIRSALGYALPPVIPFRNIVIVSDKSRNGNPDTLVNAAVQKGLANLGSTLFQCPVTLRLNGNELKLPIDPLISIACKNNVTRRYVSKSGMRGSIKEFWSQDDVEISISGVLIADDADGLGGYIQSLMSFCTATEAVEIISDFLQDNFNITKIAIESYDFPFTKGIENQSFSIKAYSDDGYELLEEV